MELFVANHPLISHKVTLLRDKSTPSSQFRQLVEELVTLLTFEATKNLKTEPVEVETPLTKTQGYQLAKPTPLIIPILRAGLGMLSGITKLLPDAEVGFLGIKRNEETLQPITYANRLPDRLDGREVFLIDPMLATGGTLIDSLDYAFERGAIGATCICLLGAPEGVDAVRDHLAEKWPKKQVSIHLSALDEKLNEIGYIVPGLGDAGDRLYGTSGDGA
jgi:uracil phosphoribosyltransferase